MKSLAFFVFLYLAIPGSGQMIWDGLPFSTRAEFAVFTLFVVVFLSRGFRRTASRIFTNFRWHGVIKPLLVAMCVAKFISFAWAPLGAGFATCYRSLYHPLENELACEKSFEAPFTQGSGAPFANYSRVDRVADFGLAQFDWNLPFMNEFPRLRYLWLERFPFSATFATKVRDVSADQVMPIFGIGELSVVVNQKAVIQIEDYSREFVAAVPLSIGSSDLQVRYAYRDENVTSPENEPEPRGPYAQLKIGEPMNLAELAAVSHVRIRGDVSSLKRSELANLVMRDQRGNPVEFTDLNAARTQNTQEPDVPLRNYDLEILVPSSVLRSGPLTLILEQGRNHVVLGALTADAESLSPQMHQSSKANSLMPLSASLTANRESLTALAPSVMDNPALSLRILMFFLDLVSLTIAIGLAYVVISTMRVDVFKTVVLALLAWLMVEPFYSALPAFVGGGRELVIPYAITAAIIMLFFRQAIGRFPLPYLLPVSAVLSAQKVFEHLHFNHPGHGEGWWGQLIFQWRDSDWFTNHGLSRAIFTGDFLRAGEEIFYVRSAPRYLLYLAHLFLGENDILIGLLAVGIGFLVVLAVATRFANYHNNGLATLTAVFVAFVGMVFFGDQTITAFGFLVTSEYSSWVLLLGLSYYLLDATPEHRVWVTATIAATLALLVQFRPNLIFTSSALLLILLLTKADRTDSIRLVRQIVTAVVAFGVVVSLSLIHNLYYGAQFVVFTKQNFNDWIMFSWTDVWQENGFLGTISMIWSQTRGLMYWRVPNDASYAIAFWGAQFCLALCLSRRKRIGNLRLLSTFIAALPLTYILPMLNFKLESYYPRHLVAASMLSLIPALIIWPRQTADSTKR